MRLDDGSQQIGPSFPGPISSMDLDACGVVDLQTAHAEGSRYHRRETQAPRTRPGLKTWVAVLVSILFWWVLSAPRAKPHNIRRVNLV